MVAAAGVVLVLGSVVMARVLTRKIAPPRVCPTDGGAVDPDMLAQCGQKLYSQNDEELVIRQFFLDRRGGVFVDVGSAHYRDYSTTYYLEHHLGWSGVAVDARPEYGPDYEKYRPATRFFSYLVTDHSGTMEPFYRVKNLYLMSTASKEWAEAAGRPDSGPVEYETVQRPTITLDDLLARAGVARIDFLSMDIETGEPAALAGFDIGRFHPDLVCIEMTEQVGEKIAAFLAAHAYERIDDYVKYDRLNGYFRPRVK